MKKTFILSENTYDITLSSCYNLYVDEHKQIVKYLVARVNWPFKDKWTAGSTGKRYSAKN